jgi:hypothetical protein
MKTLMYIMFAVFIANTAFAQTVEFQLDMRVKAKKGTFNPATDAVVVAGNFNEWNTAADPLTDTNNDTIYTITKTFTTGEALEFKFVQLPEGWESVPNREYTVPAGNSVYYAYFDDDSIYSVPKELEITFTVDMEYEIVSGRFNPAEDTLSVRGSFNGWSNEDLLTVTTDPNQFRVTVNYTTGVGEVLQYKFAFQGPRGTTWENDPNKTYTITQEDYDLGLAFTTRTFNDLTISTITNYPVQVKFIVDMNGAVSAITGEPFPAIQNAVIAGANAPLQWPEGGWPDEDSIRVHFMYDDGTNGDAVAGDNFYTIILEFPQYSPFRIQYKYGANWGLPAINTGSNDNENSVGNDHFITLSAALMSGTVNNVFGEMGDHELTDVVLEVREIGTGIPESYSLEQNYPNPFNPSTSIRFSIPESGLVTLKVYNALGQEVASLLNEEKNAGSYEYNFNASDLSSGIYFFKIQSNNYTATKKMILMK